MGTSYVEIQVICLTTFLNGIKGHRRLPRRIIGAAETQTRRDRGPARGQCRSPRRTSRPSAGRARSLPERELCKSCPLASQQGARTCRCIFSTHSTATDDFSSV
ncbi:hypothetical protein FA95DRAFT_831433 [Auriscalpium vulgare]|uniref:Uncharacterized protein n=1 Tax=Auriscalpium vulgare TaxID=40419 RepID=A0ACB8R9A9_9AGAM|nr:hypothetical protein FA95DRAFT_831433 [Auriscalpium vulgare]